MGILELPGVPGAKIVQLEDTDSVEILSADGGCGTHCNFIRQQTGTLYFVPRGTR